MTIYTKVCTKCKIEKPITEFCKDKSKKDGHYSRCKSCARQWHEDNPEYNKQYYQDNKESHTEYNKRWYKDNKQYYQDNKESRAEYQKQWRLDNKESRKEYWKQYHSDRKKRDPLFKLRVDIGSLIRIVMKQGGFKKSSRTYEILGCSFEEFKIHIESQFTEGMSWDNHGEWHYDHKIPVSWGETEEEIFALNHFSNFQPLWADDNIRKGNRFAD